MSMSIVNEKDPPALKALLQGYGTFSIPQRQEKIHSLAALPKHQGAAALCKVVRFEMTEKLSKQAAVALLESVRPEADPDPVLAEILKKSLGNSPRPAANWLRTYARFGEVPDLAAGRWTELVEKEQAFQVKHPEQKDDDVVIALLRFQIARLNKVGHGDEAIPAIRSLLQFEKETPKTLLPWPRYLVEHKAWDVVDEVTQKFCADQQRCLAALHLGRVKPPATTRPTPRSWPTTR